MQTEISFPAAGGVSLPGVFTVPDAAPWPVPGLVMIYEGLGMNDEMRRVARDLAADGYAVLIPDLFARGPVKPLCVARAIRTLMRGNGPELDDLEAARRWLVERSEVDSSRIGTIGFCLGGSFALLLARTGLYQVSAPFYSARIAVTSSCPVVASFGGLDRSTRGYPKELAAGLDALGVPNDIVSYPDAGHSFATRTAGLTGQIVSRLPIRAQYHEASAQDAHRRVVAFFRAHL